MQPCHVVLLELKKEGFVGQWPMSASLHYCLLKNIHICKTESENKRDTPEHLAFS